MPRHHQTQLGAAFSCAEEARHAVERFWCDQQRYTLRSAQRQSRRDCTKLSTKGSVHAGALAPLLGPAARACGHAGTAGLPSFSLRRTTIVRIFERFSFEYTCLSRHSLSRVAGQHTGAPRPPPPLASSVGAGASRACGVPLVTEVCPPGCPIDIYYISYARRDI